MKGLHTEKNNLLKKCFKQMSVARSIFTLGGLVQFFWTSFDMPVTGVPLKVALGYNFFFLGVSKNNHGHTLDNHLTDLGNLGKFCSDLGSGTIKSCIRMGQI